jgi:hypothetical protein
VSSIGCSLLGSLSAGQGSDKKKKTMSDEVDENDNDNDEMAIIGLPVSFSGRLPRHNHRDRGGNAADDSDRPKKKQRFTSRRKWDEV